VNGQLNQVVGAVRLVSKTELSVIYHTFIALESSI